MTPQQEQAYVNSLSQEQLQNPQLADANNQYVRARMAQLDPITAAQNAPNPQRDRLVAANQYAQQQSQVPGEQGQIAQDIASGLPSSSFDKFLAGRDQKAAATKQDSYIDSLGINSMDRYNELLSRKAINPNNPAIQAIVAGLQPPETEQLQGGTASYAPQTQPKMDGAGDGKRYGSMVFADDGSRIPARKPTDDFYEAQDQPQRKSGTLDMLREMVNGGSMGSFGA